MATLATFELIFWVFTDFLTNLKFLVQCTSVRLCTLWSFLASNELNYVDTKNKERTADFPMGIPSEFWYDFWRIPIGTLETFRPSFRISIIIFEKFILELLKNSCWSSWKIPIETLEEFILGNLKIHIGILEEFWCHLQNSDQKKLFLNLTSL